MNGDLEKNIKVYGILFDTIIKLVFALVLIAAFITLLVFFIKYGIQADVKRCLIFGGGDTLFGAIITIAAKHYFKS
jgi:hypothetical protein